MSEFNDEVPFQCPYCASMISTEVDFSGGSRQSFTIDCEICCRPIVITVILDENGISEFDVERES